MNHEVAEGLVECLARYEKQLRRFDQFVTELKKRYSDGDVQGVLRFPEMFAGKFKDHDRYRLSAWFGALAGMRVVLDMPPTTAKEHVLHADDIVNKDEVSDAAAFVTFDHEREVYSNTLLLCDTPITVSFVQADVFEGGKATVEPKDDVPYRYAHEIIIDAMRLIARDGDSVTMPQRLDTDDFNIASWDAETRELIVRIGHGV